MNNIVNEIVFYPHQSRDTDVANNAVDFTSIQFIAPPSYNLSSSNSLVSHIRPYLSLHFLSSRCYHVIQIKKKKKTFAFYFHFYFSTYFLHIYIEINICFHEILKQYMCVHLKKILDVPCYPSGRYE